MTGGENVRYNKRNEKTKENSQTSTPHDANLADLLHSLDTDAQMGLTQSETQVRLARDGEKRLKEQKSAVGCSAFRISSKTS